MAARLEHVNMTVSDPQATAAMLHRVFGWKTRWEGAGMETGSQKNDAVSGLLCCRIRNEIKLDYWR